MRFEGGGGEDYEFWGWGGGGGGFVVVVVVVFVGGEGGVGVLGIIVVLVVLLERSEHGARLLLRDAAVRHVVLGRDAEEHGVRVTDARSKESGVV